MRFSIPAKNLRDAIALLGRIVPSGCIKPILEGVLIKVETDIVTLAATDLEVSAVVELPIKSKSIFQNKDATKSGGAVLPLRLLKAAATAAGNGALSVSDTKLEWAGGSQTIEPWPAVEYPVIPERPAAGGFVISSKDLAEALGKTLFAMAKISTRYAIGTVSLSMDGGLLVVACTDSRRLAEYSIPTAGDSMSALLSAKLARILVRPPKTAPASWRVSLLPPDHDDGMSRLFLSGDGIVLSADVPDGKFPKYKDLFIREPVATCIANKAALEAALLQITQAGEITNYDNPLVRLQTAASSLLLSSGGCSIEVPAVIDGSEGWLAGYSSKYFLDVVHTADGPNVTILLDRPAGPIELRDADGGWRSILMPINLGE